MWPHEKFLIKLEKTGISEEWKGKSRLDKGCWKGEAKGWRKVTSSIPQKSIMGLILYNMLILRPWIKKTDCANEICCWQSWKIFSIQSRPRYPTKNWLTLRSRKTETTRAYTGVLTTKASAVRQKPLSWKQVRWRRTQECYLTSLWEIGMKKQKKSNNWKLGLWQCFINRAGVTWWRRGYVPASDNGQHQLHKKKA